MVWSDKLKEAGVSIHVIATGGGAGLQQHLWEVPGSSSYLSGATFPYDQQEQAELLGFMPTQFCSVEAAIDLASAAYMKAYRFGGKKPVGLGITASVASERAHRGDHRVFGCIITDDRVKVCQYTLEKGVGAEVRRLDGETCDDLGFFMLVDVLGLDTVKGKIPDFETYTSAEDKARARFFERPFFTADGRRLSAVSNMEDYALMPGTFNPPHEGHFGMADNFRRQHGRNVVFEIGTNPPHKDPPTIQDLLKRAKLLRGRDVIFTIDMPLYLQKAKAYPGVPMLIGADTMLRMLDPKWGLDICSMLEEMDRLGTKIYVSGRMINEKFTTFSDIIPTLPDELFIPASSVFRGLDGQWNISSTELRNKLK